MKSKLKRKLEHKQKVKLRLEEKTKKELLKKQTRAYEEKERNNEERGPLE